VNYCGVESGRGMVPARLPPASTVCPWSMQSTYKKPSASSYHTTLTNPFFDLGVSNTYDASIFLRGLLLKWHHELTRHHASGHSASSTCPKSCASWSTRTLCFVDTTRSSSMYQTTARYNSPWFFPIRYLCSIVPVDSCMPRWLITSCHL
jgi:hypothetical protein